MNLEQFKSYYEMAWPLLSGAVLGIVILVGGWLAAKWVKRAILAACTKAKLSEALGRFLGSLGRYAVLAAAIIAALGSVGIQTTSVLAIFATAGLAVGLALQGSLASFASGVLILFFRPIDLGDVVKVSGETGTVKDIGLFSTTLVTDNNDTVIVPNSAVTSGTIINYTRLGTRRIAIPVSAVYGTNLAKAQDVLLQAAKACELALKSPEPAVALTAFGASNLEFTVVVWSKAQDYGALQDQLRRAVYESLNRAHFDVPFPRTIVEQAAPSAHA